MKVDIKIQMEQLNWENCDLGKVMKLWQWKCIRVVFAQLCTFGVNVRYPLHMNNNENTVIEAKNRARVAFAIIYMILPSHFSMNLMKRKIAENASNRKFPKM